MNPIDDKYFAKALELFDECMRWMGRSVVEFPATNLKFGQLFFKEERLQITEHYFLICRKNTPVINYFENVAKINEKFLGSK
jgi:hypothetical protein